METIIPRKMVQGDSYAWIETDTTYPAPTWTVYYVLVNATDRITFNSVADEESHAFNLTTTDTSAWDAGDYKYQRYVSDGTDRVTLGYGSVEIIADFITASDRRSHAQKVLDAIEAVIEERATVDQEEYQIAGRQLKRMSVEDLLNFRGYYKNLVNKEKGKSNKVWVRF